MKNLRWYLPITLLFHGFTSTHNHQHQPPLSNKQQKKLHQEHRYYVEQAALAIAIQKAYNDLTLHDLTTSKASDHSHGNRLLHDHDMDTLIEQHAERIKESPLLSWPHTYWNIRSENKKILNALPKARRNSISRPQLVEALQKQMEVLRNPAIINLIKKGHEFSIK